MRRVFARVIVSLFSFTLAIAQGNSYNTGASYYLLARTQEAAAEYREAIQLRGGRYQKASAFGVALAPVAAFVQTAVWVAAPVEV